MPTDLLLTPAFARHLQLHNRCTCPPFRPADRDNVRQAVGCMPRPYATAPADREMKRKRTVPSPDSSVPAHRLFSLIRPVLVFVLVSGGFLRELGARIG